MRGSFWADESSGAPVSFWTTALKVAGSAWTYVVLGETGSGTQAGVFMVEEQKRFSSERKMRNKAGREMWGFYSCSEREREMGFFLFGFAFELFCIV